MAREPWRTAQGGSTGSAFDVNEAVRRSRFGVGNMVRLGSPLLLFLFLTATGASFLFAGAASALVAGLVYIPMVMEFIHLGSAGAVLAWIWVALCVSMYARNTPDFGSFYNELATVWTNSFAMVQAVIDLFKPLGGSK